ncbi:MAG: ferredoxin [Planctomycetota bacterium]
MNPEKSAKIISIGDTCPEVFEMGDEIAEVIVDNVPPELEETAQQAADECPVEAIVIE